MPVNLTTRDVSDDLAEFNSVLIASCPVCPPMCLAMQKEEPFIEFFKHGIKTPAFERHVQSIRDSLTRRGARTDAYSIHTPTPMMCLWTRRQRERLLKNARDYEATLVMACDSGAESVKDALNGTDCKVIQAMEMKGVINATTTIRFPLTVRMEPHPEQSDDFDKAAA